MALGYCNVGKVESELGTDLNVGTRVVSNGHHAEVVRVPTNLMAKIPDSVSDEAATFTVLGAISLQGIRLVKPTIGETVVVTGLGLIGLLAVQILKANGCKVLGIDKDSQKCALAKQFGAEVVDLSNGDNALEAANSISDGYGVDAVLITASSNSNKIIHQATNMCRKRGRIVLIGVVGLDLNRADFYEKEITFQVSCSYGPGRYDDNYEEKGNDYPIGFVRWTERRNFETILGLMATGSIDVEPLVSHRYEIDSFNKAYNELNNSRALGIVLKFDDLENQAILKRRVVLSTNVKSHSRNLGISFIGGGNYASRVLIPAFAATGSNLETIVTSGGVSSYHNGVKNGFNQASTVVEDAFDKMTDAVVIATQHNLHSEQIVMALAAQKNIYVEKPLAIDEEGIEQVISAYDAVKNVSNIPQLVVGFNRRFSPLIVKMKELLLPIEQPKSFIMTMNPGEIDPKHWTQDISIGGGRIIGEACHYIDLMRFLAGSEIVSIDARRMGEHPGLKVTEDKASITIGFADGSFGNIMYLANGSPRFPKERIEVFCAGKSLHLNNFRKLTGYGWESFKKMYLWRQDKGQKYCASAFIEGIKKGIPAIPIEEIFEVARVTVKVAEQLRSQ